LGILTLSALYKLPTHELPTFGAYQLVYSLIELAIATEVYISGPHHSNKT
jgi:hypothetical protein